MSLNDYSISKYRDAEFSDHVFPLKKKVTDVASVNPSESVNLPTSSSNDRVSVTDLEEARDVGSKQTSDLTLLLLL